MLCIFPNLLSRHFRNNTIVMTKEYLNKYFRKFGFEIHGSAYMQAIKKASFQDDAFDKQKELLNDDVSCILDIGANQGDVVLKYKLLFPSARIYAFEPYPDSYNRMICKVKEHKEIKTIQKAVGDKKVKSTLYVNNSVDTNSLLPSTVTGLSSDKMVATKGKIDVDVCTIDDFCNENSINKIDILKLDIQGGELAALKGCKKALTEKRIRLIYLEAYFVKQYVGHPLFHEVAAYLNQYGYRLQDLYNPFYGKGSIAWCDAIFLPEHS